MELNAIRLYRKKSDLTQAELSDKLNVSEMTLRRWEAGHREPRASDIKKLCEVLNVTESELLNGPQKNELRIEFVWEVVGMNNVVTIESNKFNFGFRGDDVLIWGAMADDEDEESVARKIARQIKLARVGKAAMKEAEKKLIG